MKRLLLAFTILTTSSAWQIAAAQDVAVQENNSESTMAQEGEPDEVIATGSRLIAAAKSEPVLVISNEDILARGITTIEQLFRQVSSNNASISSSNAGGINAFSDPIRGRVFDNYSGGTVINLRGAGAGSTVTLINGRRIAGEAFGSGSFVDISAIPVEAIERVEILTSGGSAIYGADAIAGVVNIVLKKNYDQSTFTARYENSASGGDLFRAGATIGKNWETGNVTVTGSYRESESATEEKFGDIVRDFRGLGGFDLRDFTSSTGAFFVTNQQLADLDAGDFFATNAYELADGAGPVDFGTDINGFNVADRNTLREVDRDALTVAEQNIGLTARIRQDIALDFVNELNLDLIYTKRETDTVAQTPRIDLFGFDVDFGFGTPITDGAPFFSPLWQYSRSLEREVEAGLLDNDVFDTNDENYSIALGLDGDISKNWKWKVDGNHSVNKGTSISSEFFGLALYEGVFDFNNFDEETFTFPELRAPINIIRSDFLTNPDAASILRRGVIVESNTDTSKLTSLSGLVRGSLFNGRKAGPVDVVFGHEIRYTTLDSLSESTSEVDREFNDVPLNSKTRVNATFAEIAVPITKELIVNGAVRHELTTNNIDTVSAQDAFDAYEASGGVDQFTPIDVVTNFNETVSGFSPKLGISYQPNDDFLIRGSIGRAFKVPTATELAQPATAANSFAFGLVDPVTGSDIPFGTPTVSGGTGNLNVEKATTINVGFDATPSFWGGKGLLTVNYNTISYRDRIVVANPIDFLFLGGELLENEVVRGDDGEIDYFLSGFKNQAKENLAFLDVTIGYEKEIFGWDASSVVSLSKELQRERQTSIESEIVDRKGRDQTEFRANAVTTFRKNNITATLVSSYSDGYQNQATIFKDIPIKSLLTHDVQLGYNFPQTSGLIQGTKVKVGATNIFDTDPPSVPFALGFDVSNYDLRRRVVYVELSKTF